MAHNRGVMARYLIGLIAIVIAAVLVPPFVQAEGSLTDSQLETIRTNCVDAQISMQHVQEADRSTRINRGYRYEAILKLMTSFNSRVAENKINAPELITIASDYQKAWSSFRTEYSAYDDAITKLIQMDCRNQPTTFSDRLGLLYSKRESLNARVKEFDGLLDKYQLGVSHVRQIQEAER